MPPVLGHTSLHDVFAVVEDPDATPLNQCLASIPTGPESESEYGSWWMSEQGQWLYDRVQKRVGKPLVLWVQRVYGPRYDMLDVANSAVDILSNPKVLRSVSDADDQWAYLFAVLKRELINQAGGYFREEVDIENTHDSMFIVTDGDDDNPHTPVLTAIQLTSEALKPFTPDNVLPHLEEIVYYFAERGHVNLSRLHTDGGREDDLIEYGVTPAQIRAVANAVLGSRPNHGENSLLAGFIQDDEWDLDTSEIHVRALEKYAARMAPELFRNNRLAS
jgi:hypothetical protein